MKMKKEFFAFLLVIFFASCKDQVDDTKLIPIASSDIELSYPTGIGTSGDEKYSLIGYGYDATGFCDTISVREKVLASFPASNLYLDYPNSASPTLISGGTFKELSDKINMPYIVTGSGEVLTKHLQSLMKLANISDLANSTYAFTYYALTATYVHCGFYPEEDMQQYLSSGFKNDIVNFSAENLVSKYGTHVLMDVFCGSKFEALYLCKRNLPNDRDICENQFYKRMQQFVGGMPFIIRETIPNAKNDFLDEKMIYNSMGSRNKICGIINATDYNPDSIRVDISSIFSAENIRPQFVTIGPRGMLPLYELINNENKKEEVKAYIENYISSKAIR
ncbi:hypothetical protein SDC9_32264 [bioreactor metagenome]|uniref:MACPF domain-containing protein n=1 Tax=bioreactor metagenome TaxID=1076179 RepID=A0A644V4R9_9ZZZZ